MNFQRVTLISAIRTEYLFICILKDYATVVGEMAPRLVEKAKLLN